MNSKQARGVADWPVGPYELNVYKYGDHVVVMMGRIVVERESTTSFMLVGYYTTVCGTNTFLPEYPDHVHTFTYICRCPYRWHAASWTLLPAWV